jgi:hypothetical protein
MRPPGFGVITDQTERMSSRITEQARTVTNTTIIPIEEITIRTPGELVLVVIHTDIKLDEKKPCHFTIIYFVNRLHWNISFCI